MKILKIFIGLLFLLFSVLLVTSSTLSGILIIVCGLLIFPKSAKLIYSKIPIKWNLLKKGLLLFILLLFVFIFIKPTNKTYTIKIKYGNEDVKTLLTYEKALSNALEKYKEAQIYTKALFDVKLDSSDKDKYWAFIEYAKQKWQEEDNALSELDKAEKTITDKNNGLQNKYVQQFLILSYKINNNLYARKAHLTQTLSKVLNIPKVFAQINPNDYDFNKNEVGLIDKDKEITNNPMNRVEIISSALPHVTKRKIIQDHLGYTARQAQEILEKYQKNITDNWNNTADRYEIASKAGNALIAGSKVSAVIGGVVLAPVVATSIVAEVVAATTVTLTGVDVALSISDNVSVVAYGVDKGPEKVPPMIKYAQEKFSPVSTALTFITLKDLILKDPEQATDVVNNLVTITGLVIDGKNANDTQIDINNKEVDISFNKKSKFVPISEDGLRKEYYPNTFEYNNMIIETVKSSEEIKPKEISKSSDTKLPCYRGPIDDAKYEYMRSKSSRKTELLNICKNKLGLQSTDIKFMDENELKMWRCGCEMEPATFEYMAVCCSDFSREEAVKSFQDAFNSVNKK